MKPQMIAVALILWSSNATAQAPVPTQESLTEAERAEAERTLDSLVADYRHDPMAISGTFGIRIADHFWTVEVERHEQAVARGRLTDHELGPHEVTLTRDRPEIPTFLYVIANMDVLRLLAEGTVNAATASMQSFGSDQVGVETGSTDGFEMTAGAVAEYYHHLSHFFTTGVPEITRFGADHSLATHGAQATALHTMKGARVLYFALPPEEIANEDPRLQEGQMPNLFIIMKGKGVGFLGDRTIDLEPGMSVFVPPFVRHEIRAVGEEPMEGVVVLYGDNGDFAFGTSYPAFLEDLYGFYAKYNFGEEGRSGK